MQIYLIGYMGSGKSTVGKKLARTLNFNYIDMDEVFEEKYHISISDFFEKYNENAFREIESQLIKGFNEAGNHIISTGGGTPCFFDNLEWMKQNGLTVYLQMSVGAIQQRLQNAKRIRPLIKAMQGEELTDFIEKQLVERETYYNQAHIIINGQNCNIDTLAQSVRLHPLFK